MTMDKLKKRLTLALVVLVLVAGSFLGGALFYRGKADQRAPQILSELIAGELSDLSEHASLEYRYTNVGKFEDRVDFYGWQVPWTTKSFIITYDGALKLGLRGNEVQFRTQGQEVILKLPPAQILSHEIYEDKIEVLDQSKNIFNPIQIEDYTSFAADRKREVEEKARQDGLFEEAQTRAEVQLGRLLRELLPEDYTLRFEK